MPRLITRSDLLNKAQTLALGPYGLEWSVGAECVCVSLHVCNEISGICESHSSVCSWQKGGLLSEHQARGFKAQSSRRLSDTNATWVSHTHTNKQTHARTHSFKYVSCLNIICQKARTLNPLCVCFTRTYTV